MGINFEEENLNQDEQSGALGAGANDGDAAAEDELPPDPAEPAEDDEFAGMTDEEREHAIELGYKPKDSLGRKRGWKPPAEFIKDAEMKRAAADFVVREQRRMLQEQGEMLKKLSEEFASLRNGMTQDRDSDRKATLESAVRAAREGIRAAAQDGDLDKVDTLTDKLAAYQEELASVKARAGGRAKETEKPTKETEVRQPQRSYSLDEETEIESFKNRHARILNNDVNFQKIAAYQLAQENAAKVEYQSGTLPVGETPLTYSLKMTERFIKTMHPEQQAPAKRPQSNVGGGQGSSVRPAAKTSFGTVEGLTAEGKRLYDMAKADGGERGAKGILEQLVRTAPEMFREQRR